jgi:hypothetical protein
MSISNFPIVSVLASRASTGISRRSHGSYTARRSVASGYLEMATRIIDPRTDATLEWLESQPSRHECSIPMGKPTLTGM